MAAPNRVDKGHSVEQDPWYERWFGEEYLRLYPHRDEDEARVAVELLLEHSGLVAGEAVLDLACGAGRHLRPLRARNLRPIGLDLSLPLLQRAQEAESSESLVRGDMRFLPFAADSFAAVTSFFTSFGYFRSEDEDRRVIGEIRRVLRPGGRWLLDFLNAPQVKETLAPRDVRDVEGRRVVQERRLVDGGRAVEKTIRIGDETGREAQVFREQVRLYSKAELARLLGDGGFITERWFGDYLGTDLGPASPRVIALARAP